MGQLQEAAPAPGHFLVASYRPYLLLALLVLAVYAQSLAFGLTDQDDTIFLNDRFHLLSDGSNLPLVFSRGSMLNSSARDTYYRPLLTASFMIDALLVGRSPGLFHLSNLVYHALAAGLVYALFRRMRFGDRALLLAAVFAVHPLLAQAVGWIPGRTDSLLAVFVLPSLIAFLDYVSNPRMRSLVLHGVFLALALLVKELAVVVPPLCLLFALLHAPAETLRSRRSAGLLAVWIGILAAWFALRQGILTTAPGYSLQASVSSVARNLPAAGIYWGKCLLPLGLSPYPILPDARWIPAIAALLLAGAALAFTRPLNVRAMLWGAGWFGAFLLPSFVYPADSITPVFFEYRAYLPLIGVLLVLAELRPFRDFSLAGRRAPAWLILLLVLSVGSILNGRHYRDARAHWERAVEVAPHSALAHNQLGVARFKRMEFAGSEEALRRALALNPGEPGVHNNLGTLRMGQMRVDEAETEYRLELAAWPENPNALFNLGIVRLRQGRDDEAAGLWERTLAVDPDFVGAYANLAAYHAERGHRERAAAYGREAVKRGAQLPPRLVEFLRP